MDTATGDEMVVAFSVGVGCFARRETWGEGFPPYARGFLSRGRLHFSVFDCISRMPSLLSCPVLYTVSLCCAISHPALKCFDDQQEDNEAACRRIFWKPPGTNYAYKRGIDRLKRCSSTTSRLVTEKSRCSFGCSNNVSLRYLGNYQVLCI